VTDYWIKQKSDAPAFPNLVWSRPETKQAAGKLLVVGGHAQSFAAPAEAFAAAEKAGIGTARVLLPDSLERTVSKLFPAAEFAPSNPSGGFATNALAELVVASHWADGVLLAGDFAKNSETIAMLENFAGKYAGQLTLTQDAAEWACDHPTSLVDRSSTTVVLDTTQLQRLGTSLHVAKAFASDMGIVQAVDWLHELTLTHQNLQFITMHQNQYVVAVAGQVSTTPADNKKTWQVRAAADAATWWLQNPTKSFEALTSSVVKQK